MRTTTTDEGEDDIMNPIYELTDHAHSEEELAPWLDACGTGRETIDGLLLTALDCAWGNWKAAAKPPMHPYANPAYLRAAETSPWRWDDCLPAGLFTYGLDTEQWHRIIAAMNDFGLSDTAIVRRDLMDGEESVLAIRDNGRWPTSTPANGQTRTRPTLTSAWSTTCAGWPRMRTGSPVT